MRRSTQHTSQRCILCIACHQMSNLQHNHAWHMTLWLSLPLNQMEGCVFFSSCFLSSFHLSLLHTLLSISSPSIHLANISPFNPNIYPSSCKLHVLQPSLAFPTCPVPPSFHPSICSPLCLWQMHLKQHITQTFPCSLGALSLSLISHAAPVTHPLLFHLFTSSQAAARCKLNLRHSHISEGDLSLWQTDVDMCVSKQTRCTWASFLKGIRESFGFIWFAKFAENQGSSNIIQDLQALSCLLKSLRVKDNKRSSSPIYHLLCC